MAVTSLNVRSMSATGRRGQQALKYFLCVFLVPVGDALVTQADLLQTFYQSLAVVEPTPGDRNNVAEHGRMAVAWQQLLAGEVRFGLDLTLLIGKPY